MLSILLPVRVGYILSILINRFHDSESFLVITFAFIDSSDVDVRLTRRIRRDTIDNGRDIKTMLDQVTKLPLLQFLLSIESNI
jgi:uridine kinase